MTIATQSTNQQNHKISELYTEAKVEQLNEALAKNSISTQDVVSIFYEPAQQLVKPSPARFRVLYLN